MKKWLQNIFIAAILLVSCIVVAQQNVSTFKQLTIDDGLSQNSVNCIHQDKHGFMWFGTQDGLNRFDGYSFKQFRTRKDHSNSLSNNYIWDIYEDENSILWIATFGGGLNSLNLVTGEINSFKPIPDNPMSFPSSRLFSITESPTGILWIGSNEGLIRFDKTTKQSQLFLSEKTPDNRLKDNYIGIVSIDNEGHLWLRSDLGLTFFNTKSNTADYFRKSPFSNDFDLGDIYDIKNIDGRMFIACDAGLVEINPKAKTDKLLLDASKTQIEGRTPIFKKITPLENHRYAIGTNRGFIIFDSTNGKSIIHQNEAADEKSLSHNNVLSTFRSKDGVIWIGTRNGLNKIETEKPDFTHIRHVPGKIGLSSKNVNSFIEENDSLIWVGTTDGLNLYDRNNNTFQVFRKDENQKNQLRTNYILCLFKDSKGGKWVGTKGNGFYKIEKAVNGNFEFTQMQPNIENATTTSVHYITEDNDGSLWLGTGGRGLWKYNTTDNNVKRYRTSKDGTGPNHPYVFTILQDSYKNIWLGTPTGGLNLFNPETEEFAYFQNNTANKHSLSNDIVLSLYEDYQHTLWIGTNGGLNKLIPKLEENMFAKLNSEVMIETDSLFTNFGQEQGFPNDVIYGMLEDEHRNLWITTNHGLVAFDIREEQVMKKFDVSHGLQNNEFNQNGYYKDKQGQFYFGGVAGFNICHPDSIRGNRYLPPVVLTRLSLHNEPVTVGKNQNQANFNLTKDLPYLDAIELSWKHDVITFDFTTLSYMSPEKNKYSYMLDGFNEDWVQAGNGRTATYTNLDSGDYIFKVKASNSSEIWNEDGANLSIRISTPPWLSWYAYTSYILLISLLIYLFLRYRIHQATQKIKVQSQIEIARTQEREAFRKRSSRDFHDEAGTRITRIALITELAKLKSQDNEDLNEYLTQIDENLQELNNGMRDFIWALDPSKDNAYDTLIRFTEFAGKFCEYGEIQFKSDDIVTGLKEVTLNMSERRHLLLILKEALNNSIKHGKPTTISFNISLVPGKLNLGLQDNGCGFKVLSSTSGNGLNNIRERAKALNAELNITSEESKGTLIQLLIETTQLGN